MKSISEINEYAAAHDVPVMMDDGLEYLLALVKEHKPARILEIGTAIARTALEMARLAPGSQVVTIERKPEMIEQARLNIAQSPYGSQVMLIEGDAREVQIPDGSYDLIFIDAAKGQYERFFVKYAPYLSADGIIISDNMNFHGLVDHPERTHNRHTRALVKKIRSYQEFLAALPDFEPEFLERGDGIAVTRRKQTCLDY